MPYGEHFGCDFCGRTVPPSEHADDCPVRVWRQQSIAPSSALRPAAVAEGTVRGDEALSIAREMQIDAGTWTLIPTADTYALVDHVKAIVAGAERTGWRFVRPVNRLLLRTRPFLVPTLEENLRIFEAVPEYASAQKYEKAVFRTCIQSCLASMSQLGWNITGPQGRQPEHEGGVWS